VHINGESPVSLKGNNDMECFRSEEYLRIRAQVVPDRGPCDTLEGEALRAAARLAECLPAMEDLLNPAHPISYTFGFLRKIANHTYPTRLYNRRFRNLVSDIEEGLSQQKTEIAMGELVTHIVMEIERIGVDRLTPNRINSHYFV
jgi:hypothetical protein